MHLHLRISDFCFINIYLLHGNASRERPQTQPHWPNGNASRMSARLPACAFSVDFIHTFGIEINAVSDVSHWLGQEYHITHPIKLITDACLIVHRTDEWNSAANLLHPPSQALSYETWFLFAFSRRGGNILNPALIGNIENKQNDRRRAVRWIRKWYGEMHKQERKQYLASDQSQPRLSTGL